MKSIKRRLWGSHFIVVTLTVIVLEVIVYISLKNYYYMTIENTLKKECKRGSNFYEQYIGRGDLTVGGKYLIDNLKDTTDAQIQIIDTSKVLVLDSIGLKNGIKVEKNDVESAIRGSDGSWTGYEEYTAEKVMSVSYPLRLGQNKVIGVVRCVSSLEGVQNILNRIMSLLILLGLILIFSISVVSIIISYTIIKPLRNLTESASNFAKGNYKIRAEKIYNDEVGTLSDTFNYMVEEIQKNEKLKNEFISSISHELRTPLTSIKGWALTLLNKKLKDEKKREQGLNIIAEETERLSGLLEELLDFSRLEGGKITLNKERLNLTFLLENVYNQMKPRGDKNGINITFFYEEELLIFGDKNRLKQIFINILDNSLKFTDDGGEINILCKKSEGNAEIEISDDGCGIKSSDLPYIKDKFFKGDSKRSGSGIGLSICDEIVKLHGGEFNIYSEEGNGTKVLIKLPLDKE